MHGQTIERSFSSYSSGKRGATPEIGSLRTLHAHRSWQRKVHRGCRQGRDAANLSARDPFRGNYRTVYYSPPFRPRRWFSRSLVNRLDWRALGQTEAATACLGPDRNPTNGGAFAAGF